MKDISNCKIKVLNEQHAREIVAEAHRWGYVGAPLNYKIVKEIYFHLEGKMTTTALEIMCFDIESDCKEIYFYQGEFHEEPESLEVKPSVGVCPRNIFWEKAYKGRIGDLLDAMKRYHSNGKTIPLEWVEELEDLVTRLEEG